jgi:DNA protecting protein DprA
MSWVDFFAGKRNDWLGIFQFTEKELNDLEFVQNDMSRLAFQAERLYNEGFQVIPINSPDYPSVLKENLKTKSAPPVLYVKGKKDLFQKEAVAIVGSRNAGTIALEFTDAIARKCAVEGKVVVSGFARGVDKQALDSTLEARGKSIIVLPQGILTFQSGFKKYYEPIINGEVLVLSTFFPGAAWDVGLAMARNVYIYGLAREIYVAESDQKGGTWEGALNGLKRQRKIYVRIPEEKEKNANLKLIELGAIAVDKYGVALNSPVRRELEIFVSANAQTVNESSVSYHEPRENVEKNILEFLTNGAFTIKEILEKLKLDWDSKKLSRYLRNNSNVKIIAGRPVKYTRSEVVSPLLFD